MEFLPVPSLVLHNPVVLRISAAALCVVGALVGAWLAAFLIMGVVALVYVGCVLAVRTCFAVCGWVGKCVRKAGEAGLGFGEMVVLLPLMPMAWARRWLYSERWTVVYRPVPAVTAGAEVCEMASPGFETTPTKIPKFLLSFAVKRGSEALHVGFGVFAKTADHGNVVITAQHVLDEATDGEGRITLSHGGNAMHLPVKVCRSVPGMDQVWLKVPSNLGSVLSVSTASLGKPKMHPCVSVFSPLEEGGIGVSHSVVFSDRALALRYKASTVSGSSGSPIVQGKRVVGIHVRGSKISGVVWNKGYGVVDGLLHRLETYDSDRSDLYSEREQNLSREDLKGLEYDPDYEATAGFYEVEDILDHPAERRKSGLLFTGKSYSVARAPRELVPVKGRPWDEYTDDESDSRSECVKLVGGHADGALEAGPSRDVLEASFRSRDKTPPPADRATRTSGSDSSGRAFGLTPETLTQPASSPSGRSKQCEEQSELSGRLTLTGPQSSMKPCEAGVSPTGPQQPSEGASDTKQESEKSGKRKRKSRRKRSSGVSMESSVDTTQLLETLMRACKAFVDAKQP